MEHSPQRHAARHFSRDQLASHLRIERSSLPRILDKTGLKDVAGRYPRQRILRAIHGTEGALLADYLARMKDKHGSPVLHGITDLQEELLKPLKTFEQMAHTLGCVPNTLSRSLREGRASLPFKGIRFGPRLRRYRPLDIDLWTDDEIILDLPPIMKIIPQVLARESAADCSATPETGSNKAIFGPFAHNIGKPAR